jgi:type II secretory pathway component PulJ
MIICRQRQSGIALAELLVGLMVGSIVLAAAAAMASAMSCGKQATEQMTRNSNYLAHVHTRVSDLVMRAESISAITDGVLLTYSDGITVQLYKDSSGQIVIETDDGIQSSKSYMTDPNQGNVSVAAVDSERVSIAFDITENSIVRTYTLTATRRGGK